MPMQTIPLSETQRHSSYDPQGYLFRWNDALYRAIRPGFEEKVTTLFECGLVEELVSLGLFPKSEITGFSCGDCSLVIRHEKVPVVTLPFEWSFSMLKEAAKTVLEVNMIARKYGYQTLDAHGFNVLFFHGRPLFVDLGSFIKIEHDFNCARPGWRPYGEFIRFFLTPLKLWSQGYSFFARHSLHGDQVPQYHVWRLRNPLLRFVPARMLQRFEFLSHRYRALNTVKMAEFLEFVSLSDFKVKAGNVILALAKRKLLWFSGVNLQRLHHKIDRIRPPHVPSAWAAYQKELQLTERHRVLIELLQKYRVRTALDMAGNAGFLSRQIISQCAVDHVVCVDYDENAIDILFESLAKEPANITPALMNFSITVRDDKFESAVERFKSEAVLAMALTHHLLLSQSLTVDFVVDRLRQFSTKYVFVEFMPLGLYSSHHRKLPTVPEWYNLDWFRAHFERRFTLLEEEVLEKNRVLLVGECG